MTEREAIHKLIMFRRILERGVFPVGYKFDAEPFDMAISALEKQEQDRWIPVKERLPEYGVEVLTQLSGSGFVDIVVNWVIDEEDEMWFEGGVVAWRPLPEPYTEEEA